MAWRLHQIRENITPIGDGNIINKESDKTVALTIRENITPIGDGNLYYHIHYYIIIWKIRENITPIGDGNHHYLQPTIPFLNKRKYNSDRRRKRTVAPLCVSGIRCT